MPLPNSAPAPRWSLAGPPLSQIALQISHLEAALSASNLLCSPMLAQLLAARGITDAAAARVFLDPRLSDLHEPSHLLGMAGAVARIQHALACSEPILIYGDYDVDGTTATVLLKTAIERIAPPGRPANVSYHVPHRLREGYGMQNGRLAEAAAAGVRLVISVDTGIRAFAAASEARKLGLDLIVTDHHLPDGVDGVPDALAVINPAQAGCTYPNKSLCGAGVAFKLAHALLAAHADTEVRRKRLETMLLPSFLKLVAIATVADSVELTGENRTIVALGLRELRNPVQPGLRALMQVASLPLDRPPTTIEVGFRLAPRINAAGRMDVASDVVELFSTRDGVRASELADKLNLLNEDRRATEAAALEAIELQLGTLAGPDGSFPAECVVLDHPAWHRGVLGILASRVVDRTGRPALIMTTEADHVHGSGRSVTGFHLLDALTEVHAGDLFTRFGGHAHAVGFTLPASRLHHLRERMSRHSASLLTEDLLAVEIPYDFAIEASQLGMELLHTLERCAPFGMGNTEPQLLVRDLVVAGPVRIIKERHVCIPLALEIEGRALSAMGWSRTGQVSWADRCQVLHLQAGSRFDAICRLRENKHPQYPGLELELVDLSVTRAT